MGRHESQCVPSEPSRHRSVLREPFRNAVLWGLVMCGPLGGWWLPDRVAMAADPPQATRLVPPGGHRGETVEVSFQGTFPSGQLSIWTNRPGLTWEPLEEPGKFRVQIAADADPGIYLVRGSDAAGVTSLQRFIVGTVREISETEPNDAASHAEAVTSTPVLVNGVLGASGDVDHFAVSVTGGQTLVASIDAERQLASPLDACLQILDDRGRCLAANLDYHGLDPHLEWMADRDRTVIVRVFGFPASPDSTIGLVGGEAYLYRLTITPGPYIEAAEPMALSSTAAGTPVRPLGWNLASDVAAVQLSPPPDASTVTLAVENAAGSVPLPIVPYPVYSETQWAAEDPNPAIPVPACIGGCISEPRQVDTFAIQGIKGAKLQLRLESRSLGYPLDAVMRITDEAGAELASQDDNGQQRDPTLDFAPPADGIYRVTVTDLNGFGDPHYYYRLTIAEPKPEFSASSAADSYRGKVNEPLEIPVQIVRSNGFAGRVEVAFAELPEGWSCPAQTSEPEGDSSKEVKLALTATTPHNGPLHIVARELPAADASQPDRRSKTVQSGSGISELWFTIE